MEFTNRETYKAAVIDWKQRYHQTVAEIRAKKIEFKEAQRAFSKFPGDWYTRDKAGWAALDVAEDLRSDLKKLAKKANDLVAERVAGKIEANRQYLEEHSIELMAFAPIGKEIID